MEFQLQTLEEYSDEALLSELRKVAESLNGKRLTIERFNSVSRVHYTTIKNRFGSWRSALDKAGIGEDIAPRIKILAREEIIQAIRTYVAEHPQETVTRNTIADQLGVNANNITRRFGPWRNLLAEVGLTPVPLGRRYSDKECFENLLALWTYYGRQPHFAELKQPPSKVGTKAYVGRWGGWRAALSAFVKHVNDPELFPTEEKPQEGSAKLNALPHSTPLIPRSICLALRYKILSRDRFRCVICGASPAKDMTIELHVDHIIPWSRGGLNTEDNLRTLCFNCNLGKGDKIENA